MYAFVFNTDEEDNILILAGNHQAGPMAAAAAAAATPPPGGRGPPVQGLSPMADLGKFIVKIHLSLMCMKCCFNFMLIL